MDPLRVLVVDDEVWIRAAVSRDLQEFHVAVPDTNDRVRFEVAEAGSGEEALEIIEANPPHIMLLDLKLPGISGLDVLERVARQYPDLLTVMITAYASIETAVRATKSGAYDFVAKPFTPEELEHVLQKAARHIVITERARALAQEQHQVRFQFVSVLAHELKAPLNAIEGFLDVVLSHSAGDNPSVYEEMLRRSLARTRSMRKLIVDLLDLTRIESGVKKRELSPVDLLDVAQTTVETAAPDAAAKGVTIQLHCEGAITMHADRTELEIVLNNFVSNAVKYNRQGGRVSIDISRRDDVITIAVSDTGIGMSQEEVERLFQPFMRIRNEKTAGILGSGLGLTIAQKVALLYNGEVNVTSEPEVGSTFTITLRDTPEVPETARK